MFSVNSIKTKLVGAFFLTSVLPLLVVALFCASQSEGTLVRSVLITGIVVALIAFGIANWLADSIQMMAAAMKERLETAERSSEELESLNSEVQRLIQASREGRLDERGNDAQFQGTSAELVKGVNEMLDAILLPIKEAASVLDCVAARELTARVVGDYKGDHQKIKDSLNRAVLNLDEGLQQVAVGAEQVCSAADQISGGSQTMAQGASEQASSLEEVSSSLQEMAAMAKQNAANSHEARGLSDAAREAAAKGVEKMERLSAAMGKIKASSDETAKIVKTIDEIAFQTNLLALNAAVEAARAGDGGRGFAVVAEEVRNLAMRSAEAAKRTADLIEESVHNSDQGVAINQEVLGKLKEINVRVEKVSEGMSEIAAASEQQNEGVAQVNQAVEQINQVTLQIAANSEEAASAAEELSSQAAEMNGLVGKFTLSMTGATGRRPSPSSVVASTPTKPTAGDAGKKVQGSNGHGRNSEFFPHHAIPAPSGDQESLQEF